MPLRCHYFCLHERRHAVIIIFASHFLSFIDYCSRHYYAFRFDIIFLRWPYAASCFHGYIITFSH